jgi:hypothetical protein
VVERIGIWKVTGAGATISVQSLEEMRTTETEQRLEELLVASPDVLMPELTLVGRQVPTGGGPLDLIGIDQDGRLVLFELKRGTLTRDAVAQILDYGSDLQLREPEDIAILVQENSGRNGVERIPDFADWYQGEFPDVDEMPPVGLRMVLVGLGVDERAKRMVNFLAASGVDIQLLTFQAFISEGQTLLARNVETVEPTTRRTTAAGGTKEANRRILEQSAKEKGVESLFFEVADFVEARLPGYRWPGKTAFTFSLQEMTEHGRPSLRAYASLYVDPTSSGRILFALTPRAAEIAHAAADALLQAAPGSQRTNKSWMALQVPITLASWPSLREPLERCLAALKTAWIEKVDRQQKASEESA